MTEPMLPKLMAVYGGAPLPAGAANCEHADDGEGDGETDGDAVSEGVADGDAVADGVTELVTVKGEADMLGVTEDETEAEADSDGVGAGVGRQPDTVTAAVAALHATAEAVPW